MTQGILRHSSVVPLLEKESLYTETLKGVEKAGVAREGRGATWAA